MLVGQGQAGQPRLRVGAAGRHQPEHRRGQRGPVQPGLGVVQRAVDGLAERRVRQQRGRVGGAGAQPGEQRVQRVGVGDVEPGQPERGDGGHGVVGVLAGQQHGGRAGRGAVVDERDGQRAQLVEQAGDVVGEQLQLRVERAPPGRRPLDAEQPDHQLGDAEPGDAQGGRRGRRGGQQPVEAGLGELRAQPVGGAGQVEPLGRGRGQLAAGRRGQPAGPAQRLDQLVAQPPVQLRAREADLGTSATRWSGATAPTRSR